MTATRGAAKQQAAKRDWSWAAIEAAHTNTRAVATIQLNTGAVAEIEQLLERHARLRGQDDTGLVNNQPEMTRIADRIRVIMAEIEKTELTVVFEALGRSRLNALRAEHPAPKDQAEDELYGPNPGFDVTTFPPALLSAACIEPADMAGNVEAWTELHDTWNTGAIALFFRKASSVQQAVQFTPKAATISERLKGTSSSKS